MEKRAQSLFAKDPEHALLRETGGIDPYAVDKNAEPQSFQEMLASFVTPGSLVQRAAPRH